MTANQALQRLIRTSVMAKVLAFEHGAPHLATLHDRPLSVAGAERPTGRARHGCDLVNTVADMVDLRCLSSAGRRSNRRPAPNSADSLLLSNPGAAGHPRVSSCDSGGVLAPPIFPSNQHPSQNS